SPVAGDPVAGAPGEECPGLRPDSPPDPRPPPARRRLPETRHVPAAGRSTDLSFAWTGERLGGRVYAERALSSALRCRPPFARIYNPPPCCYNSHVPSPARGQARSSGAPDQCAAPAESLLHEPAGPLATRAARDLRDLGTPRHLAGEQLQRGPHPGHLSGDRRVP